MIMLKPKEERETEKRKKRIEKKVEKALKELNGFNQSHADKFLALPPTEETEHRLDLCFEYAKEMQPIQDRIDAMEKKAIEFQKQTEKSLEPLRKAVEKMENYSKEVLHYDPETQKYINPETGELLSKEEYARNVLHLDLGTGQNIDPKTGLLVPKEKLDDEEETQLPSENADIEMQ